MTGGETLNFSLRSKVHKFKYIWRRIWPIETEKSESINRTKTVKTKHFYAQVALSLLDSEKNWFAIVIDDELDGFGLITRFPGGSPPNNLTRYFLLYWHWQIVSCMFLMQFSSVFPLPPKQKKAVQMGAIKMTQFLFLLI